MTSKRSRRPLYITLALALYAAVMAIVNLDTLTVYHDYLRYFGTLAAEIVILCLLYFFLRRREQLRREREADLHKGPEADPHKDPGAQERESGAD